MTRLFWVEGRLSWPFVIALAYLSASLIVADYVWRIVVMPFDTLLIYIVAIDGVTAALLIGVYVLCGRRWRKGIER
jgi:predicted membrane protein